jgi:hypothetical protein
MRYQVPSARRKIMEAGLAESYETDRDRDVQNAPVAFQNPADAMIVTITAAA